MLHYVVYFSVNNFLSVVSLQMAMKLQYTTFFTQLAFSAAILSQSKTNYV